MEVSECLGSMHGVHGGVKRDGFDSIKIPMQLVQSVTITCLHSLRAVYKFCDKSAAFLVSN